MLLGFTFAFVGLHGLLEFPQTLVHASTIVTGCRCDQSHNGDATAKVLRQDAIVQPAFGRLVKLVIGLQQSQPVGCQILAQSQVALGFQDHGIELLIIGVQRPTNTIFNLQVNVVS